MALRTRKTLKSSAALSFLMAAGALVTRTDNANAGTCYWGPAPLIATVRVNENNVGGIADIECTATAQAGDANNPTASTTINEVIGGTGNDLIVMDGAMVRNNVYGFLGNDTIQLKSGSIGLLDGSYGRDVIEISGGRVDPVGTASTHGARGAIYGGRENDTFIITGGEIGTATNGVIVNLDGSEVAGALTGNDSLTMTGGAINGRLPSSYFSDRVIQLQLGVAASVYNTRVISIWGAGGNDTINIGGSAEVNGAIYAGLGDDTIAISGGTVDGDVAGEGGADTINLTGGTITGTIWGDGFEDLYAAGDDSITLAGATVTGDIDAGSGNDSFEWTSGALAGGFSGQAGNDTAAIRGVSATDLAGTTHLEAGTGDADELTFDNIQYKGGSFSVDDVAKGINLGAGWDTINLTNGTEWTLTDNLTLGDPTLNIDASSVLLAGGGVNPVISAAGGVPVIVNNSGLIDLTNGGSGATDRLAIFGDYVGNSGRLALDTVLAGDGSASDMLVIDGTYGGSASGATTLIVTNAGGTGVQTVEGIKLVDAVNGATTTTDAFALQGDYVTDDGEQAVIGGAYAYTLKRSSVSGTDAYGDTYASDDWYLRSALIDENTATVEEPLYQPATPAYETYPQALLGLMTLPTMQQRIGDREDRTGDAGQAESGNGKTSFSPIWIRAEAHSGHIDPNISTTGSRFDQERWQLQAGTDIAEFEAPTGGRIVLGATAHVVHSNLSVSSAYGDGSISTMGYGLGLTATWLASNGFYVDGQSKFSWFDSDLSSDVLGSLTKGNRGFGYGLSLEAGKKIALPSDMSLTPQAQLAYTSIDLASFIGPYGEAVSLAAADSLRMRLGLSMDRDFDWANAHGRQRAHVYAIANVYNEFKGRSSVIVSGTQLVSDTGGWMGEIGAGFTRSFNDGKYALYGEVNAATSLTRPGNSNRYGGTIGLRVAF